MLDDFLALSGAFATLVGLLANFKAERSSSELSDFMNWLRDTHQDRIADAIDSNKELSGKISGLLSTNHEELVSRLQLLTEKINQIGSQIEGFSGIAELFKHAPNLSSQAISVLRQIANSGAKYVLEHKMSTGDLDEFIFIQGKNSGQLHYEDARFIDDDLRNLVATKLLNLEYASKGSRKFSLTRLGLEYINTLDK